MGQEREMREEMGVIESAPSFGMRDGGACVMWFGVKLLIGGFCVILSAEEAIKLIEKHHIENIETLAGKPVRVRTQGLLGGHCEFVDLVT